jgi:hypothetical protein
MSGISRKSESIHAARPGREPTLAAAITRAASQQTYYTIRFLADRDRAADAYRAYAYFRWVDDRLDDAAGAPAAQAAFVARQRSLLATGYRGEALPADLCPEERLLAELIAADGEPNSGLQSYLRNMMAVMAFDAGRRGRAISQAELSEYTRLLATAVTDALFHFIGHDCGAPCGEARYLAVSGAHVIHMLRDTLEDCAVGYFNVPAEYLAARGIAPDDVQSPAYREWVAARVRLARRYFRAGRAYLAQVENRRCRLAGYAYLARFEWMAGAIERDGYRLRAAYPERKSPAAGLWMAWRTLASWAGLNRPTRGSQPLTIDSLLKE